MGIKKALMNQENPKVKHKLRVWLYWLCVSDVVELQRTLVVRSYADVATDRRRRREWSQRPRLTVGCSEDEEKEDSGDRGVEKGEGGRRRKRTTTLKRWTRTSRRRRRRGRSRKQSVHSLLMLPWVHPARPYPILPIPLTFNTLV